jgi:hypothetical protein
VETLVREENVNKTTAMQLVRTRYPEIYQSYQRTFSTQSAQQQQFSRSGTNEYAKRAVSYEDLLGQELVACNGNEILAKQRLIERWGNSLPSSVITKHADDLVDQLQEKIESICDETDAR